MSRLYRACDVIIAVCILVVGDSIAFYGVRTAGWAFWSWVAVVTAWWLARGQAWRRARRAKGTRRPWDCL